MRTEPLKALVIGAFVRGLSMHEAESLCEQAALRKPSKSTASRNCEELRDRYEQFKRRDLYRTWRCPRRELHLGASPSGPKVGVLVVWGVTEAGERMLPAVMLGMRESYEDWQAPGRDLIARGPRGVDADRGDGAPGLITAIEALAGV